MTLYTESDNYWQIDANNPLNQPDCMLYASRYNISQSASELSDNIDPQSKQRKSVQFDPNITLRDHMIGQNKGIKIMANSPGKSRKKHHSYLKNFGKEYIEGKK